MGRLRTVVPLLIVVGLAALAGVRACGGEDVDPESPAPPSHTTIATADDTDTKTTPTERVRVQQSAPSASADDGPPVDPSPDPALSRLGYSIGGTVVDEAGVPLADADVTVVGATVQSAADGTFRVAELRHHFDGRLELSAELAGYTEFRATPRAGDHRVRVVLRRAARVSGRIAVLEGLEVASRASDLASYLLDVDGSTDRATGTVEEDGSFDVAGLPAGAYRISMRGPLYAETVVHLTAGEHRTGVHLEMAPRPRTVLDVVVRDVSGVAVPGRRVRVRVGRQDTSGLTDLEGRARVPLIGVPAGEICLASLMALGFDLGAKQLIAARAVDDERPPPELVVPATTVVTLRFIHPDGSVSTMDDLDELNVQDAMRLDDDRRRVWPDRPLVVNASIEGEVFADALFPPPGLEDRTLDIPLQPFATVRGRVVNERGAVVDDGAVAWSVHGIISWLAGDEVRTEPDGTFAIPDVPAGTLHIIAASPGLGPEQLTQSLQIAAGESRDLGTLRLAGSVTVRGVVRDPSGEPLGGALVVLGIPALTTASRRDGTFAIRVSPISKPLRVRCDGFAGIRLAVADLDLSATAVNEIELRPESRVRVRIVTPSVARAFPFNVGVQTEAGGGFWDRKWDERTDPFEPGVDEILLDGLSSGRLTVQVYRGDWRAIGHVVVAEGETGELSLTLRRDD